MLKMVCFTQDSPKGKGRQDGQEIFPSEGFPVHIAGEIREGPVKKDLLFSE